MRRILQTLSKCLEYLLIFLMALMVVDVTWQVLSRYVFKSPSSFTEELATFLLIWIGLLGSSYGVHRKAHLGLDVITSRFTEKGKIYSELFIDLAIALFAFFVMLIGGIELVRLTLKYQQISPALGIEMGYVYLALPISGFFIVIYCLDSIVENLRKLIVTSSAPIERK
jgi:TRAP-type C4-dicarboxylate transport system permease small subunit